MVHLPRVIVTNRAARYRTRAKDRHYFAIYFRNECDRFRLASEFRESVNSARNLAWRSVVLSATQTPVASPTIDFISRVQPRRMKHLSRALKKGFGCNRFSTIFRCCLYNFHGYTWQFELLWLLHVSSSPGEVISLSSRRDPRHIRDTLPRLLNQFPISPAGKEIKRGSINTLFFTGRQFTVLYFAID